MTLSMLFAENGTNIDVIILICFYYHVAVYMIEAVHTLVMCSQNPGFSRYTLRNNIERCSINK